MPTTVVKIGVFCTCGMPLEQVHSQKPAMNYMTFKPCQCCSAPAKIEMALEEKKQFNRRGVMVNERST
jgi:hypothetical protein